MALLSKAAFEAKYNDAGTGIYRDGQAALSITEEDHRFLVTDTKDSAVFLGAALTSGRIPYSDSTGTIVTDANMVRATLADGVAHLTFSGTMPTVITGQNQAFRLSYTSAGSSSQLNGAMLITYNAGYTGSSLTWGARVFNSAAGTGSTLIPAAGSDVVSVNIGSQGESNATTAGTNVGLKGGAQAGDVSVGVLGLAQVVKNSATNIGGAFSAINTGTSGIEVGVWGSLNQETIPTESAAAIFDNDSQTSPILLLKDNGTTVFTVDDGGAVTATNLTGTNNRVVLADSTGKLLIGTTIVEDVVVTRALTTSEILNANSTPIELAAAPGAGFVLFPYRLVLVYDFITAAFATNTTAQIQVGSSGILGLAGVLNQGSDQIGYISLSAAGTNSSAGLVNQNMSFTIQTGNPTGGGTSTAKVIVHYHKIAI